MIKQASTSMVLGLLLTLGLAWPATADEQEEAEYPHGAFEDDCTICHGTDGWTPAVISDRFDHSDHGFSLLGTHARTNCRACHVSLEFDQAETACVSCHGDVHQGELGTDCARCHTPRSFIDRAMMTRAHVSTRFPLRGTHRSVDCEDCHELSSPGTLQWVNTPVDCDACHLGQYLATTDPDHQASAFPRTCDSCHRPRNWSPASFNHNILPPGSQCVDCHREDYLATTNPDHQAAGFPLQCEACHNTRSWAPAAFDGLDHDARFFPIYSGRHDGEWNACSDCHVAPNTFANFECIQCHEHNDPGQLADDHSEVSGYAYNSQACYTCHPRGT